MFIAEEGRRLSTILDHQNGFTAPVLGHTAYAWLGNFADHPQSALSQSRSVKHFYHVAELMPKLGRAINDIRDSVLDTSTHLVFGLVLVTESLAKGKNHPEYNKAARNDMKDTIRQYQSHLEVLKRQIDGGLQLISLLKEKRAVLRPFLAQIDQHVVPTQYLAQAATDFDALDSIGDNVMEALYKVKPLLLSVRDVDDYTTVEIITPDDMNIKAFDVKVKSISSQLAGWKTAIGAYGKKPDEMDKA